MGFSIFLMFWLTLWIARGTPIGRFLSRFMVDLPAAALDGITRSQGFWLVAITMLTIVAIFFQEADTIRLVGLAIPDAAAWLTTVEIGTYLDVLAAVVAASAAMRPKNFQNRIGDVIARVRRRRYRGTARPPRTRGRGRLTAANDDEHRSTFALAS